MAGAGGGPTRRSHTKSRKGCEACKRRHIRCGEEMPQCSNCTKHKVRCPYNDIRSVTPEKPDLLWTVPIEAIIKEWKETGCFPFPELNINPAPSPVHRSMDELRLIYHVAEIYSQLERINANSLTIWTRRIPLLLQIGATFDFVMDAILAFSAAHIASLTNCRIVENMGLQYKDRALKGLGAALGAFSGNTADAILAASLVLSWQATDWNSFATLMGGTFKIIKYIESFESQFGDFMSEISPFPKLPPSPMPDHQHIRVPKEHLELLLKTSKQLSKLDDHLKKNQGTPDDAKHVSQLQNFVKQARKTLLAPCSVEEQFSLLVPLRNWLFYLPFSYLNKTQCSRQSLVVLSHYYAVGLSMERLLPDVGAAYYGRMVVRPLDHIAARLECDGLYGPFLEMPINTLNAFRARMGWMAPAGAASFSQFTPPHFYANDGALTPPTTYAPYPSNPAFSYSMEDVSVCGPDPGTATSMSPVLLPISYATNQYLNLPSPSYGSAYSPASSSTTFAESPVVWNDNEEYACFPTHSPVFGNANNFDVRFVPPVQTVWI